MYLFMLVSVLLEPTRLIHSRYLHYALITQLEKIYVLIKLRPGSDWGVIGDKPGSEYGERSDISIEMMINKQYWLYLGNESNMIDRFFDTGFAYNRTL